MLVTGVLSGLGKAVHERFGGKGLVLTRSKREQELEEVRGAGVDVIVHCAANTAQDLGTDGLHHYFEDNVLLTGRLAGLPHRKFVLISSVDVYPASPELHREDEALSAEAPRTLYATSKLLAESVVRERCPDHLILRCSALLGKHSRKNSLIRMLEDSPCKLTLSGDSEMNYVLHDDVLGFLDSALERDFSGIYNAASAGNVTLSDVAALFGKEVSFGDFRYDAGRVDNGKAVAAWPGFRKSSRQVVSEFAAER
ncbi:NAD-dependent epimerase/dehydratase family protein [Elusimicrobiota bacterium]